MLVKATIQWNIQQRETMACATRRPSRTELRSSRVIKLLTFDLPTRPGLFWCNFNDFGAFWDSSMCSRFRWQFFKVHWIARLAPNPLSVCSVLSAPLEVYEDFWLFVIRPILKSDKFTEIWQFETAMPRKSRSRRHQAQQHESERWIEWNWIVRWEKVPISTILRT